MADLCASTTSAGSTSRPGPTLTIKAAGTYRYATEADAIVLAYAIGDGPVRYAAVSDFSTAPALGRHAVTSSSDFTNVCCAARRSVPPGTRGFDRAIWNYATAGFPGAAPHHIIDVMAQATASGLPPDLALAAKQSQVDTQGRAAARS